jgi:serine protease Do
MAPVLRAVVRLRTWRSPSAARVDPTGRTLPVLQVRHERGFVVDGQGYVVTGDRVVSDARHIEVLMHDGRTYQASLVARDPLSDVAILKVPATGLPTIVLGDSRDLVVGEQVLVTGGTPDSDRGLAPATVRATARATGGNLMVDLPPRPEAVGAPVLNRRGHAVGVLTSDARSGGVTRSMTFAVPIDRVKAVLRGLPSAGSSVSDR